MLESRGLNIGPWRCFEGNSAWTHAALPGAWARTIADAASGAVLGFAAWRRSGRGPLARWFGLSEPRLTYGRLALIQCDERPAVEVLEIVTPE